ncbi:MAG: hypothetical protein II071_05990, partial [Bacteroidales bacterium]|nr:hypothetical protein [Bacteroidales bacterium]
MFTLVPVNFFNPASAREALAGIGKITDGQEVLYKDIPQYSAVLIYTSDGKDVPPEVFFILDELPR